MVTCDKTYFVHDGVTIIIGPWNTSKPEVEGVYQRDNSIPLIQLIGTRLVYCYYDGHVWYQGADTPEEAMIQYERRAVAVFQRLRWRGLLDDPYAVGAA